MGRDWIQKATRYRYSFAVMAELERDQGCKFVTLIRRLDASDKAIRQALDYLIEIGWVMRNSGHGHPSRPEYVLTSLGCEIGVLRIWESLLEWGEEAVALERWPLPVLHALLAGSKRFGEISKNVGQVSPRALTIALSKLQDSGLAVRTVLDGHPPATEYSATRWGRELGLTP